ncbi:D-alanyl-D-alanine carboxypeptidase [Rhodanobacter sp. C01]|nr:D-alanyl-D-alanine carboxypeptidase [Rhodanobacter sp. C01]
MFAALFLCGLGGFAGVAHAGYAAIVVDPATGQVLNAVNPDEQNYPASLAKMMTLYLTLQSLQSGKLKVDQQLPVSAWAAAKAPTKLGLRRGQTISVGDCILGMITKSANDAATVVAEGLGGSEGHFADMMNAQAARLGMTHTHFDNASGLPDPASVTTARDMVTLAMALYHDYPQYTHYFAAKEFMFRGRLVRGHNRLMDRYPGMDGLKTGFTDASGFNLASTAVRDGQRLFGVVMGGHTAGARDQLMARLLDDSFDHQQTPAILVAQAAGVGPSMTRRMLAALSPIGSAEAETVPVRQRQHRRGKRTVAASGSCTPHKGVNCPRRDQAHHPARGASTRLATQHRRNGKQQKATLASRHADPAKAP